MPAKSQKQRAWAFGVKGPAWAKKHHMDNKGPLPEKVSGGIGKALMSRKRNKRRKAA